MMKGCTGKKGKKLVEIGITTVAQMKSKTDDELLTISNQTEGISLTKLKEWRDSKAHVGSCPYAVVDYRRSENPYKESMVLIG